MSNYDVWNEKARLIWAELTGEEEEPAEDKALEKKLPRRITVKNLTNILVMLPNGTLIKPRQAVQMADVGPGIAGVLRDLINKGQLEVCAYKEFPSSSYITPGTYTGRVSTSKPNMEQVPKRTKAYSQSTAMLARTSVLEEKNNPRVQIEEPPNLQALRETKKRAEEVQERLVDAGNILEYAEGINSPNDVKEYNRRLAAALNDVIPVGTRAAMRTDGRGNIWFNAQYTCSKCGSFCKESIPAATLEVVSRLYGEGKWFFARELRKNLRDSRSFAKRSATPNLLTAIMGKNIGCRRCRGQIDTETVANSPGPILRRRYNNYKCRDCGTGYSAEGLISGTSSGMTPTILLPDQHTVNCTCGKIQVFR